MAWYDRGLKGYWKRRPYRRVDGDGFTRARRLRKNKIVLGEGRKRRIWRIRVSPRLLFLRALSPKRLISRIRDAYVRMMLTFAHSGAVGGYGCDVFAGFQAPPVKEYDERMIIEIYKSLLSQGQLITTSGVGQLVIRR